MACHDLFGVVNDEFYKRTPPQYGNDNWIGTATIVGTGGWKGFQFLFFDPEGMLYGVYNDKFYKRLPPAYGSDNWIGSATLMGSGGWSGFKFLFFDPQGILYGVEKGSGRFHRRIPPTDPTDNWLGLSTLIGTGGWNDFYFPYFMPTADSPDGELYSVYKDKFYKGPPPTPGSGSSDNWLGSATMIGTGGWSAFEFLMSPLGH
ncbi:uncharacterized protein LOC144647591 [Oculina patagonica]